MSGDPRPRPQLPRRAFLEVLAAAPCALAACATARERPGAAESRRDAPAPAAGGASATQDAAAAAVRALQLPRDAEPACVFRAAAARPGAKR